MPLTRHISANIKSNPLMTAGNAREDINEVGGLLSSRSGSIGWQEIAPAYYKDAIRDRAPRLETYWPPDGAAEPIPISYTTDLTRAAAGWVRAYTGGSGDGPSRGISWIVLINPTGQTWWHVNTHFIAKAWTSRPERKAAWWAHNAVLLDVVREMRRTHGSTGIVTGDFNRSKYVDPKLVELGARYHWTPSGSFKTRHYDYLISFGRWSAPSRATERALNSDHDAAIIDLNLPKASSTTPEVPKSEVPKAPLAEPVFEPSTPVQLPVAMGAPGGGPLVSVWTHLEGVTWRKVKTIAAHQKLTFMPVWQDFGFWSWTGPFEVGSALLPGRLVTIDWRGKRSTWGIDVFHPSEGVDSGSPMLVVAGSGAKSRLGWCDAWPDGTQPLEAQPIYHPDKAAPYVGPAETILSKLAAVNLRDRYGMEISIPEPVGIGGTVRVRPQFENLFELVQTHAKDGGVGFDIGLESTSTMRADLWLRFTAPVDRSRTVRLSSASKTIAAWDQMDTAPTATHAIVAYGPSPADAQTTLSQDVSATSTAIVVRSSEGWPNPGGETPAFRVVIGQELLSVTGVSGKTWTVVRGLGTTVPTAHTDGDPVRPTRFYRRVTTDRAAEAAAEWGGARETYVSGPDSRDAEEITASGRAALSAGAETRALTVTVNEAEGVQAFIHFDVGDIGTSEVLTDTTVEDNISAIEIVDDEASDSGISVKAIFGNPGSRNTAQRQADLIRALRRDQRRSERR